MRINHLVVAAALGAIALAACGSGGSYSSASAKPKPATPVATAMSGAPAVKSGMSSLGAVLVDAKGLTLYGLTDDRSGTSTCVGVCANVWPPLSVAGASLPAGLDAALFSVVRRPDGAHQLKAGKWPLYTFSGDAKPGDVNGEGTGGVWFAVGLNGNLVKG
jgi:predicted lipoprotein with Yx(FWY)xxD motif